MNERTRHLKVKIKNLADEARTIRQEESKTSGMERWSLQHHRKTVVRRAARHNLLAYAFLRGRPYSRVESACTENTPDWKRIRKIALDFGGDPERLDDWILDAEAWLAGERRRRELAGEKAA
jgi:hypothetical protein